MPKKTKTKPLSSLLITFSLLSVIAGLFFAIQKNPWLPTLSLSDATLYNDIIVRAKGEDGREQIGLRLNGEIVKRFNLTKDYKSYVFRPQQQMTLKTVEVVLTNSVYKPKEGIDYNAHVDFIKVNGKKYETEHPTTRSKGSWVKETHCREEINPQSEIIHCDDGYMRYNVPKDTIIGQQRSDITIADITVEPTESEAKFTFKASEKVQAFVLYGTQDLSDRGPHEKSFTYDKHVQTLRNLAPNTTYKYRIRVNNKEGVFAIHNGTFTTEGGPGQPPVCGNQVLELGEQCDDGNTTNGDGCSRTCQVELISTIPITNIDITPTSNTAKIRFTAPENVQAQTQYATDTSYSIQGPHEKSFTYATHVQTLRNLAPNTTYNYKITVTNQAGEKGIQTGSFTTIPGPGQPPVCGNQVLELGEQCDDGNTTNGDGCSRTCQVEPGLPAPVCGNGAVESGEQCDDGNTKNGDGCSGSCQNESTPPTGNAMTFSQIKAAGLSNACYPDNDHYVAEFLYQNPDACFWQVNGSTVTKVATPTPPANAIKLPKPSGGDDTSALAKIINANPGKSFVGAGGTYRLNNLEVTVSARIWNVPSQPVSSSTDVVWEISAKDVHIYGSPIDGNNSAGIQFGWELNNGADRFHLINSGMRNVRVTDGGSMSAVYLRGVDDYHICGNHFEDLINVSGKGQTARANAIWQAKKGEKTSGGYIVNNTSVNLQSNGDRKDSEFYTRQTINNSDIGVRTKIFANRLKDSGKRFTKFQAGGALVASNRAVWTVKGGNVGAGDRGLLAFVAIIQDGTGPANNVSVRNNHFTTEKETGGRMDRIFTLGPSGGGVTEDMHIECNHITINSNDQGLVPHNPSIFYFAARSSGKYSDFKNSSIKNNLVNGSGGIEHYWDFATWNYPRTGWNASNIDIAGNKFLVPATVADYE